MMTLGSSVEVARNEMGGARRLDFSVLVGIMHGRRRIARILMARSIRADFSVGLHGILMPLVFMPIVLMRAGFGLRATMGGWKGTFALILVKGGRVVEDPFGKCKERLMQRVIVVHQLWSGVTTVGGSLNPLRCHVN